MKELADILAAFDSLCAEHKPSALATVIRVEGSAYRRPGARMLIAEDGRTWGGVSGGCLERDVANRGRGVIETAKPVVCRYETSDDEELPRGAATGCGGTVHLLIQRLSSDDPGPMPAIRWCFAERRPVALATLLDCGRCTAIGEGDVSVAPCDRDSSSAARSWARLVLSGSASGGIFRCEGSANAFVERILPPQSLVIFGAGRDVAPVVTFARGLGWHVTVVGARPATGLAERFRAADRVHVTGPADPLEGVDLRPDSAVVLMTHNLARDRQILGRLPSNLPYLGILGPLKRTRRLLADSSTGRTRANVFAPVGLDVGAETPEEIALAIVAEIQSALRRAAGGSLRDRPGPIHPTASEPSCTDSERPNRSAECQSSPR